MKSSHHNPGTALTELNRNDSLRCDLLYIWDNWCSAKVIRCRNSLTTATTFFYDYRRCHELWYEYPPIRWLLAQWHLIKCSAMIVEVKVSNCGGLHDVSLQKEPFAFYIKWKLCASIELCIFYVLCISPARHWRWNGIMFSVFYFMTFHMMPRWKGHGSVILVLLYGFLLVWWHFCILLSPYLCGVQQDL